MGPCGAAERGCGGPRAVPPTASAVLAPAAKYVAAGSSRRLNPERILLKAQNKSTKSGGLGLPCPSGRRGQPSTFWAWLLLPLSSTDFFFFPGLALPGGGAADGRRERPPAKRFLILHFNRFQKAPWRNANRLKCQNREGVSSRSADLILFSALIFFGGGREGEGSAHAKKGFGEGRAA